MQVTVTAAGPDNVGLADPIIHYVTSQSANIAEIQMYDHNEEALHGGRIMACYPASPA